MEETDGLDFSISSRLVPALEIFQARFLGIASRKQFMERKNSPLSLVMMAAISVCSLLSGPVYGEDPIRLALRGWGTALDPDGDCKFIVEKGRLTIGLPGTDHSLSCERGQMNSPRVLQEIEGDFIVQVKVSGTFPTGATSIVPNRRPFHGAGLLLWQDEKNYIRLERAETVSQGKNMAYASFEDRKEGTWGRRGDASGLPLTDIANTYLRLERRGGTVHGAASADGIQWSSLEPINIELPKKVSIGINAGSNTSSPFEPVFEEFKVFIERTGGVEK
jgi:regulation of enolase protein 1 (concanavalin A-like superfamily)